MVTHMRVTLFAVLIFGMGHGPAHAQVEGFTSATWFNACGMPPDYHRNKQSIFGREYSVVLDIVAKGADKGRRTVAVIDNASGQCSGNLPLPALPDGPVFYHGFFVGNRVYILYYGEDKDKKEIVLTAQWIDLPGLDAGPVIELIRSAKRKDGMERLYDNTRIPEGLFIGSQTPEEVTLRFQYSPPAGVQFAINEESGMIAGLHYQSIASNGERIVRGWTFDRDLEPVYKGTVQLPEYPMTYKSQLLFKVSEDGRAVAMLSHLRSEGVGAMMGIRAHDHKRYLMLLDGSGLSRVDMALPSDLALLHVDLALLGDHFMLCGLAVPSPLDRETWGSSTLVVCPFGANGKEDLILHGLGAAPPASRMYLNPMPDGTYYVFMEEATMNGKEYEFGTRFRIINMGVDGEVRSDTQLMNPRKARSIGYGALPATRTFVSNNRLHILILDDGSTEKDYWGLRWSSKYVIATTFDGEQLSDPEIVPNIDAQVVFAQYSMQQSPTCFYVLIQKKLADHKMQLGAFRSVHMR